MVAGGQWLIGSQVPWDASLRGRAKMVGMAAAAIDQCLPSLANIPTAEVPLLLCVAEPDRPGRISGLDDSLLSGVAGALERRFHTASRVIAAGRVGGVQALDQASELIAHGRPACLVAGVDTYLDAATISGFDRRGRLLSELNSNGFIPGEAAAAALLGSGAEPAPGLVCEGIGFGQERATIESDEPLRADGLVQAIRAAIADAGCTFDELDFRVTDFSGEQYTFKEGALALARAMKRTKREFDVWHPADCIGEVGAAVLPIILGMVRAACIKGYSPGNGVLVHCGNDDGRRAAMVLRYVAEGTRS